MRWVAGGSFRMGSDDHYPEERPARLVTVEGFWIDRAPVTNAEFGTFIDATGYRTVAERTPSATDFPGASLQNLVPGSAVFRPPPGPVPLDREDRWWRYLRGAYWRRPGGPGSSVEGLEQHPVVHVAFEDAASYAEWAKKELPTEEEWEFAARAGSDDQEFAWGGDLTPGGRWMANTWQGPFPWRNLRLDGFEGTSPVGSFPPNAFDLVDMIGNVWEWTDSGGLAPIHNVCCAPQSFAAPRSRRVIKGGSYLCSWEYCARYRPAARQLLDVDSSTSHVGFRCVKRG